MNKKYLSAILFGTLLAASTGTFTSCKDYDDDIKALQEQIDKNGTTVGTLQEQLTAQLTALQAALQTAQSTADAAKADAAKAQAAADAAKAAGDAAAAEAAQAKVLAEAAKKAAADAEAKALAKITEEVTAMKEYVDSSIAEINATKADKKDLEAAIVQFNEDIEGVIQLLGGRIDGVQAELSTLTGTVDGLKGDVVTNANNIQTAQDAIKTLIAADENLQLQLDALKAYDKELKGMIDANKIEADEALAQAIKKAEDELKAAQEANQKLWDAQTEENSALRGLIGDNAKDIKDLQGDLVQTNKDLKDLGDRIDGELDKIKADMGKLGERITTLDTTLRTLISTEISNLHVLIVARLSSIAFAPDYIVDGVEAVKFSSLQYSAMNPDENALVPTKYNFSVGAPAIASYHFNPKSFNLANATYSYLDRTVTIIETGTRAAGSNLVDIIGQPIKNTATGTVDFTLRRKHANIRPAEGKTNMIALQATMTGDLAQKDADPVITSPYVAVYDDLITPSDLFIADGKTLATGKDKAHFATTFDACAKIPSQYITYDMAYDKVFNLKQLVATCYPKSGTHAAFPIEDYKLSYKFSVASSSYEIENGETVTDQQDWFLCNDENEGLYQAKGFNKELIGRTPIVKVELVDETGKVVRRAFVKLNIGVDKYEDLSVGITENLVFDCAETEAKFEISEQYIRDNVYRVITDGKEAGMSHEEFWNMYGDGETYTTAVTKGGKSFTMSQPRIAAGATSAGIATKKIVWSFTHGELKAIGNHATFVASVTVKNKLVSSEFPAYVTFNITVDVTLPTWTWAGTKNSTFWENDMYVVHTQEPGSDQALANKCIFNTPLTQAYVAGSEKVTGLPECTEDYYEVIATVNNGVSVEKGKPGFISGVYANGLDIELAKNNAAVEKALNSSLGLQALVAHKYQLESGDIVTVNTFMVNFIRPVNLNMREGLSVTDGKDGGDIVSFQWDNLLTDWRGFPIVNGAWERVTNIRSFWQINCAPEYKVIPAYQEVVTPAQVTPEYGTVEFTTEGSITMYKATATYRYTRFMSRDITHEFSTGDNVYLTKEQALKDLELQARKYNAGSLYSYAGIVGEASYSEETVASGTLVKYEYVKGIIYTEAVYETHPAEIVLVSHKWNEHTRKPNFDGTEYGQTVGCWTWTKVEKPGWNWTPGKYWDFYGQFEDIKLDIAKAYTDIEENGNTLPNEGITLTQIGNTVKYVNAGGAQVIKPYVIYIPASVKYGWGTTTAILTISVNTVK
ncbi:coiled-coil domain-containing protein [Bacteroides faecis]|uniref:coiled-coil domain-containing protein n=1 Tax=Bacteroides faecis TaxID=674529 RepID=UPI002166A9D1|nr:cell surface protein [Bacteroides faecis]MCS2236884.1 cell surface protein [Bacteroides faecis]MCS3069343.1 cell surface protein [Bacteroides faecis]